MTKRTTKKLLIILLLSTLSFIGFMFKLPRVFSHYDKELHFLFYFCAAFTLNYLIDKKTIGKHILIGYVLFLCGVFIEAAQEFSNHYFEVRIHGSFDIEDIIYNFRGLLTFSVIWIVYRYVKIYADKRK
jgi:VanZ family protein